MTIGYKLAYRFGLTPWEKAGEGFGPQIDRFAAQQEQLGAAPGKALDVGCGTGEHAVALAQRGWQVTGIDVVPKALKRARGKAASAGQDITFVGGDVTQLDGSVGEGFRLVLDVGCFHGLTDEQRSAYAREVTAVSEPRASLLLFAFGPGRRGPLPRGVGRADLERTFAGWTLSSDEPADTSGMPGPLKKSDPRWYRFVRN